MGRSPLLPWLFVAPALALVLLTVLLPALMALLISFTQTGLDLREPLQFIGLANLRRLLADPMFLRVLGTTFIYLMGVVPPIVLGSLALAVLVNRSLPGVHWFRAAFYTFTSARNSVPQARAGVSGVEMERWCSSVSPLVVML